MKTTVNTTIESPAQTRFSNSRTNAPRNLIGHLTQAFGEKLRRQHEASLRRSRTKSVNAAIGTPA